MTSGRRILINDASTPLLNGDYTVTNAGSATQRWQLTRINYHSGGFLNTVREWYVSNPLSDYFGSRWACSQQTINTAQVGISQAINFSQQNVKGLKTSPNSIQIDGTVIGVSDFSIETDNSVGFGVTDTSTFDNYLRITNYGTVIGSTDLTDGLNATIGLSTTNIEGKVDIIANDFSNNSSGVQVDGNNGIILYHTDDLSGEQNRINIARNSMSIQAGIGPISIQAGAGVIIQSNTDEVLIQGEITATVRSLTDAVNIESIDGSNSVRVDGVNSEVSLICTTGQINLSSTYLNVTGIPTYANDAAADADALLLTGSLYKTVAGGRAVFQKP